MNRVDEGLALFKVKGNRPGTGYVKWSVRVQGSVGIGYGIIYPESRARGESGRRVSQGAGWTENGRTGNDARATSVQKKHARDEKAQGCYNSSKSYQPTTIRRQPLGLVWCSVDLVWEGGYARDPATHYARMEV